MKLLTLFYIIFLGSQIATHYYYYYYYYDYLSIFLPVTKMIMSQCNLPPKALRSTHNPKSGFHPKCLCAGGHYSHCWEDLPFQFSTSSSLSLKRGDVIGYYYYYYYYCLGSNCSCLMYVCMYVCMNVVYMYVCMYVCMYECSIYVCMYVCMYVCSLQSSKWCGRISPPTLPITLHNCHWPKLVKGHTPRNCFLGS
jgi:hypothetical protein